MPGEEEVAAAPDRGRDEGEECRVWAPVPLRKELLSSSRCVGWRGKREGFLGNSRVRGPEGLLAFFG